MKQTTIAIAIVLAATSSAQWTVVNLHPAGAVSSQALGVGGGQQVGWAHIAGEPHASLWTGTAASWVDLHPPAQDSIAYGVKGGQQVGIVNPLFGRASLWTGTVGSLVDLHPLGPSHSWASAVSGGQQVGFVGFGFNTGNNRAALWSGTASSYIDLHPAGAVESKCLATDGDQQAGTARIGKENHASLWIGTAASWVDLHPPGAIRSYVMGIDGGEQGGSALFADGYHAILWRGTAASWVDLQPAGAHESDVRGVYAGRQAGSAAFMGIEHAGLWSGTAGSWVDSHEFLPGGFLSSHAMAISHEGGVTYVVGYGNESNFDRALMWVSQSIAPMSFSMFRGTVFSGNLASLIVSDSDRLVVRPGPVLSSEPPVQVRINSIAPDANPDGISFSVESSASFTFAQQKVSLWNYDSGAYELVETRVLKTTDDTLTVTVRTNAHRFIDNGTLEMRALVSFKAIGPSLTYPWSARIDKAWWTFPG